MKFYEVQETCFLCGRMGQLAHHHLMGGPNRKKSDKYGLVVPLCPECHRKVHEDRETMLMLHQYAEQKMLCSGWTMDRWITEFGKNYV